MFKEIFLLGTGILAANALVSHVYYHAEKERLFRQARDYCDSINKPLLNVGCGNNPMQIGDVNVDVFPPEDAILPNYMQADMHDMPFSDKQFGAAIAFHVLEHVDDPKAALKEMDRVADRVIVSVPAPFDLLTDTCLSHKYTFYWGVMEKNNPVARTLMVAAGMGTLGYLMYREEKPARKNKF